MKFFNKKIDIGTSLMIALAVAAISFVVTLSAFTLNINERLGSLGQREQEFKKLSDVRNIIYEYYIGEPNEQTMTDYALYGYVAGIGDKYSRYYNAEDYALITDQTSGRMVGIGVSGIMDKDTGYIKVTRVFDDSPAAKAGLRAGDLIYAVDSQSVPDIGYETALVKIRGAKGEAVLLSIRRGESMFDLSVVRDTVVTPSVSYQMVDEGLGYLKISEFSKPTFGEVEIAVEELRKNGARGLILDLRSNLGGTVDSLVEVLDYFLPEGEVLKLVNRAGTEQIKKSYGSGIDLPLAVIINGDTASAGEVCAEVLREIKGFPVVGTQSYGKWTSQSIIPLGDGTGVSISNEISYTPGGKSYEGIGIEPDYVVEIPDNLILEPGTVDIVNDPQLKKAWELLR